MAKDYEIAKTSGQCSKCEKQLDPGDEFMATVCEREEEFARVDFCLDCWPAEEDGQADQTVFGVWRTRVPQPQEKKKLFVDNELLINFFERLDGTEEQVKINFRFVLALILMRKKLLVYDGAKKADDGTELWQMHFKGGESKAEVVDPKMDEDQIAEVSSHLGEILEGEL
jgi:hypothetical protein